MITAAVRQKAYAARERRAIANAERFPSKREAFRAGYKTGYTRAYRAWRARYERALAALKARDEA